LTQSLYENNNLFQIFQKPIDSVCGYMEMSEVCLMVLKECKREFTVHFPVQIDVGSIKLCTGYSNLPPGQC
jgi:hypothetical protein